MVRSGQGKFIVACIMVAAAFAFLLHLGFWQLERLHWKEALIAKIEQQKTVDPRTVGLADLLDDSSANLMRGALNGVWVQGKNMRVGPRMMNDQMGYWIITPFTLSDGTVLLVNRGWTSEKTATLILGANAPSGIVTLTGTLRQADNNAKDAAPVAGNAQWWHGIEPDAMARAQQIQPPAKMILFMDSSTPPDDAALTPAPVVTELRNEHKNYAIFWFTMAGVLLLGFLAGAVRPKLISLRGKNSASSQGPSGP